MKKLTMFLIALMFIGVNSFAASGDLVVGGNTTVAGNLGVGTTTPDAKLQVNGTVKVFGAWSAKSPDIVYQATTDGFIIVNPDQTAMWAYYSVYTDSNNPPTTLRVAGKAFQTGGSAGPATIPVRKGDYWKVLTTYGSPPSNVWWMPLGL